MSNFKVLNVISRFYHRHKNSFNKNYKSSRRKTPTWKGQNESVGESNSADQYLTVEPENKQFPFNNKKRGSSKLETTFDERPEVEKEAIRHRKVQFLDRIHITVRGGSGGQGLGRFGGIGGSGGNVIIKAKDKATLKSFLEKYPAKRFKAKDGSDSKKLALLGQKGEDLILEVPLGIQVINNKKEVLGDVEEEDQTVIIARGGDGGNQINGFVGMPGEHLSVSLDLKLIADIGLVGFPNAGKSTFLSAMSRASPKIAAYPFTTRKPQLGTIEYPDLRQITLADLPGLIEGAWCNFGMGHVFLKHVERTKLLIFMVDLHGFQLNQSSPHRSAIETIALLNKELEMYKKYLVHRPAVLAINKVDTEEDEEKAHQVLEHAQNLSDSFSNLPDEITPTQIIQFDEIFLISAKHNKNIDNIKFRLRELMDSRIHGEKLPSEEFFLEAFSEHRAKQFDNVKTNDIPICSEKERLSGEDIFTESFRKQSAEDLDNDKRKDVDSRNGGLSGDRSIEDLETFREHTANQTEEQKELLTVENSSKH